METRDVDAAKQAGAVSSESRRVTTRPTRLAAGAAHVLASLEHAFPVL